MCCFCVWNAFFSFLFHLFSSFLFFLFFCESLCLSLFYYNNGTLSFLVVGLLRELMCCFCVWNAFFSFLFSSFSSSCPFSSSVVPYKSLVFITNASTFNFSIIPLMWYYYFTNVILLLHQHDTTTSPTRYCYFTNMILLLHQHDTATLPIWYYYFTNYFNTWHYYFTNVVLKDQ